jgi:hypothetical protein
LDGEKKKKARFFYNIIFPKLFETPLLLLLINLNTCVFFSLASSGSLGWPARTCALHLLSLVSTLDAHRTEVIDALQEMPAGLDVAVSRSGNDYAAWQLLGAFSSLKKISCYYYCCIVL